VLAAQDWSNQRIGQELGLTDKTVRTWRGRIAAAPALTSLNDRPRSGRPATVPLPVRLQLVSLACERPADTKTPFREVWTQESLRAALLKETNWLMSTSEVGRILRAKDIRPHRIRMWLNRQDPRFWEKAERVCQHYVHPDPGVTVRGGEHLRVRKRGAVLTIESGDKANPWPHARLRRDTVHLWLLEMAVRGGRWERTPFRGLMNELVDVLFDDFPWTIAPVE
jgi:transposase